MSRHPILSGPTLETAGPVAQELLRRIRAANADEYRQRARRSHPPRTRQELSAVVGRRVYRGRRDPRAPFPAEALEVE